MFKIPEITYPLRLDTIGKLLAVGYEMTAYCENEVCRHRGRVNLVALANRLGMDHSSQTDGLVRYIYCPRCREAGRPDRKLTFRGTPSTDPYSVWPREQSRRVGEGR